MTVIDFQNVFLLSGNEISIFTRFRIDRDILLLKTPHHVPTYAYDLILLHSYASIVVPVSMAGCIICVYTQGCICLGLFR